MPTKMITAANLKQRLQAKAHECEGLDEWIGTELIRLFSLTALGAPVKLSYEYITAQRWAHHRFVLEMQRRGFVVGFVPSKAKTTKGVYTLVIPVESEIPDLPAAEHQKEKIA